MNLLATAGPDPSQVLPWVALVIYVVGLAGIVIPVLPGLMLCVVAVLVWAIGENDVAAWLTLAVVAALWALVRGLEDGRTRWLVWAGVFVGLGFETKMAAALMVVAIGIAVAALKEPAVAETEARELAAVQ